MCILGAPWTWSQYKNNEVEGESFIGPRACKITIALIQDSEWTDHGKMFKVLIARFPCMFSSFKGNSLPQNMFPPEKASLSPTGRSEQNKN